MYLCVCVCVSIAADFFQFNFEIFDDTQSNWMFYNDIFIWNIFYWMKWRSSHVLVFIFWSQHRTIYSNSMALNRNWEFMENTHSHFFSLFLTHILSEEKNTVKVPLAILCRNNANKLAELISFTWVIAKWGVRCAQHCYLILFKLVQGSSSLLFSFLIRFDYDRSNDDSGQDPIPDGFFRFGHNICVH